METNVIMRHGSIGSPTTINLSRIVTSHGIRANAALITDKIEAVIRAVVAVFGVERQKLLSHARPEYLAWPRQVAMALSYEFGGGRSLAEIGELFGGRDHGTVAHATKRVESRCSNDVTSREQVEAVKGRLAR